MKHKYRVWYDVTTFDGWWWVKRKWIKEAEYGSSSNALADTFKKALKIAYKCPAEMIITKWYKKHGRLYCRDMILHPEERRKI